MTRIEVRDFGPIVEGAVDLKPLTVFIGPNNSGKSYMALLVYALSQVMVGNTSLGLPEFEDWRSFDPDSSEHLLKGEWTEALEALSLWRRTWEDGSTLLVRDLPDKVQHLLATVLQDDSMFLAVALENELQRCFGTHISQVVRSGADEFSLTVQGYIQDLLWDMQSDGEVLTQTTWRPSLPYEIDLGSSLRILKYRRSSHVFLLRTLIDRLPKEVFPKITGNAHHLPASRTGLLLGHKLLASIIVSRASRVGIEPLAIPRLPGPVADFIQGLLLLEPSHKPDDNINQVIDYLESNITLGRVDVDRRAEYPEIYFEDKTGQYQLNQISSMLSEMAPLVLYLKYVVRAGERLIIEEPEAHLHAGNQRHLASAIAMVVNAGVNVLVTTHSNLLLSEINNLLLASGVENDGQYAPSELLAPEQVGAYFFEPGDEGTRVEAMDVTREDGISVESFARVHEALYDEGIRLQYAGT